LNFILLLFAPGSEVSLPGVFYGMNRDYLRLATLLPAVVTNYDVDFCLELSLPLRPPFPLRPSV